MKSKEREYIIPEYSLTGDLLSYLTCGLQYRYQNRGALPPSKPVQLWFGEYIHGVMEEAYKVWKENDNPNFPWGWNTDLEKPFDIRRIELQIYKRLGATGLYPPPMMFCPTQPGETPGGLCHLDNHPHQLIASKRAVRAINTWGPHLFPLIHESEIKLKGLRDMPRYDPKHPELTRSNYYGIKGIADVISSISIETASDNNKVVQYINKNDELSQMIDKMKGKEYEVIIDYKGMRRKPQSVESPATPNPWAYHEWQILTYAWLRSLQHGTKPVISGILFYLNELDLSVDDTFRLKKEVENKLTDVMPVGNDLALMKAMSRKKALPNFSDKLRERRSIRVVPVNKARIKDALSRFDGVINEIEDSIRNEMHGVLIKKAWDATPEESTCTACDFKTYCPKQYKNYHPSVP